MRRLLVAVAFVLLVPWHGQAAPVCVTASLANYIALGAGGCEVGPALLSDFYSYTALQGATEIAASEVTVTPSVTGGGIALEFGLTRTATDAELLDILIHYSVSGLKSDGKRLELNGASATGNGVVSAIDDTCVGDFFLGIEPVGCQATPLALIVLATELDHITTDVKSFAVASFFDVFTNITLDGGLIGTASLDGSVRTVFAAPEPPFVLLMGAGVAAVLMRRRMRWS